MVTNVKIIQKLAVVFGGKVLVLKRSANDPSRPNTWDFAGGNVDDSDVQNFSDEILLNSLAREISEEAGVNIDVNKIETIFLKSKRSDDGRLVIWIGYQYKFDSEPAITLSSEHSEYKWVTRSEYENLDFGFAKDDFIYTGKKIDF